MKTMILKAAALTGLAALIPATVALSAYASEVRTNESAETVLAATEEAVPESEETVLTDADGNVFGITKTITVTDEGTEDGEEETVYYYCDGEGDDVMIDGSVQIGDAEGLVFLIGYSEMDPEADMDESEFTTLTLEEADALAQEKLTAEQYARWQELTVQTQDINAEDGALDELTELLAAMTDGAKWHGISYTVSVENEDGADTVGYCTISDGEDDGTADLEETVFCCEYTEDEDE